MTSGHSVPIPALGHFAGYPSLQVAGVPCRETCTWRPPYGTAQFRMTGVVDIAQGITEHGRLTNREAAHERRF